MRALDKPHLGHRFRGACGMLVYLLAMDGPGRPVCLLELRAQPPPKALAMRGIAAEAQRLRLQKLHDLQFHRAMLFLRLIAHERELRSMCDLQAANVTRLEQVSNIRAHEEARLRKVLHRALPGLHEAAAQLAPTTRAEQVVRDILDRVHHEYTKPLELTKLASEFGMNASYLSTVFARQIGMPFKAYLTTLRIQRAQELLRDPKMRVSEVAYAVGYSNPRAFRIAFERWAGLAPRRWRDLMRV